MDRKISTADLKVGMYVSRLDRPWMQTPFLLQGFFIEDQSVINKLVKYCVYVYIDTDMGEESDVYLDDAAAGATSGIEVKQRLAANRMAEDILNASKKPVMNADLWHDLIELTARHKVEWHWVKGHSGHPENDRVDALASDAAEAIAAGGN